MVSRPPLADDPRLSALFTLLLALVMFGEVMPWVAHEPPRWPFVIGTSVLLTLFTYLARTRSARFQAYMLVGVSVFGLAVYGAITFAQGFPRSGYERLAWAAVIAVPVAGLALAWWMLRRPLAKQ
ncbi:MAG: hypothetical protein ACR2GG_02295 [Gemmatimonadaceae bacterium]